MCKSFLASLFNLTADISSEVSEVQLAQMNTISGMALNSVKEACNSSGFFYQV